MTKCPIGFGCSKYYLFIFGAIIFKLLSYGILFSVTAYEKIGLFDFTPKLSKHLLIQSLYKYIGFIIGGLLFYYCIKIKVKGEKSQINVNKSLELKGIIHNIKSNKLEKISITHFFFVCFIFSFHKESLRILDAFYFNIKLTWYIEFIFG